MDKLAEVKLKLVKGIDRNIGEFPKAVESYGRTLLWLNLCELVDVVITLVKDYKKGKEN